MITCPDLEKKEAAKTEDLSALLKEANYLVNSWVKATFKNAEDIFFRKSAEKSFQFCKTLFSLEQLKHTSMDGTVTLSKNGIEYLQSVYIKMAKLDYGYVLYDNPLDLSRAFLTKETNHIELAKTLIKKLIRTIDLRVILTTELYSLLFIFQNLSTVICDESCENLSKTDLKFISCWIKFINQLMHMTSHENSHVILRAKKCIAIHGVICAIRIAVDALNHAKSDMQLLMAESFASAAYNLYQEFESYNQNKGDYSFYLDRINAAYALIASKNNDCQRMLSYSEKLSTEGDYSDEILQAFLFTARKIKDKDPLLAINYFNKAIIYAQKKQTCISNHKSKSDRLLFEALETVIDSARDEIAEIKEQLAQRLKKQIKENCPEFAIRKGEKPGQLILFMQIGERPFIAKKLQEELKVLHIEIAPHDKGLHVVSNCLDENTLLKALNKIKNNAKLPSKASLTTREPKPEKPKQEKKSLSVALQQVNIKEEPIEPYVKPQIIEKQKTRPIGPLPAPTLPTPVAVPELHTQDFGFNVQGNPLITPVYCSIGAQKAQRTKLYLRWEGIPGCDASVEKQFQEMLNPHPEGILTVGTYGQAGAKLWKDPEGLGEDWGQCALRLKRLGAAGFLRAIAIPESKIDVELNGVKESRYLFKLGKMKHK